MLWAMITGPSPVGVWGPQAPRGLSTRSPFLGCKRASACAWSIRSLADQPSRGFHRFLVALAPGAGLAILRQTFVRRCQSLVQIPTNWGPPWLIYIKAQINQRTFG